MTQNNEREAFEVWFKTMHPAYLLELISYEYKNVIYYGYPQPTEMLWNAWKARAQSPISQDEQQEPTAPLNPATDEDLQIYQRISDNYTSPPKQAIPDGWISIKDELPPEGVNFLALTWFGDRKHDVVPRVLSFIPSPAQGGITYWMPILTAPTNTEVVE